MKAIKPTPLMLGISAGAFAAFVGLLSLGLVIGHSKASAEPEQIAPIIRVGGPFSLIDQSGKPVTEASWDGKIRILAFGYTESPDITPRTLQKIAVAIGKLSAHEQATVQPLFITLDPERDTPAALASYTPLFSAHLLGLTGSPDKIRDFADAYDVIYNKNAGGASIAESYSLDYSNVLFIMNKDGSYLEMLRPDVTNADDIAKRLKFYIAATDKG